MRTVIHNGNIFDTSTMSFPGEKTLVIEDAQIVDLTETYSGDADVVIDAHGAYVVPGLIDAHVHFRLATLNFRSLTGWSEVEFGIRMGALSANTVQRGFTTVRDLGGDVKGLISAIQHGAVSGPRIVRAGLMLTQTGGHGDADGAEREVPDCACQMRHTSFGLVADGVDAVRKGARHLLRDGSDFLKVHVSGGVASPSDPIDSLQYTPEELIAAVTEAEHRHTYVAAHAYTPEAIQQAVNAGVHCIEHGNLINAETASLMKQKGSILVPTLVTYEGMDQMGQKFNFPRTNIEKNKRILEAGLTSLETAMNAGVTMGFGTDLIGEIQVLQNKELSIRAQDQPAKDILHSMWSVNPALCRMEGLIGTLTPGAFGDVVISHINPLEDITAFSQHETAISHVIQGGIVVRG